MEFTIEGRQRVYVESARDYRTKGTVRGADGKRISKEVLARHLVSLASFLSPEEVEKRVKELTSRHTAVELAERIQQRESFRHTQKIATGSVHTHDFQSDIYGGQYKVTGFDPNTGKYEVETLAPSAEVIGRILEDVERGSYYVNPGQDAWEEAEKEIQRREESAGERRWVKFISAEQYHAAF